MKLGHNDNSCTYDPHEIVKSSFKYKDLKKRLIIAGSFLIGSMAVAVITLFIKTKLDISESFSNYLSILFFCSLGVFVTAVLSISANILHYIIALDVESKGSKTERDQIRVDLTIITETVIQDMDPQQRSRLADSLEFRGASDGLVGQLRG